MAQISPSSAVFTVRVPIADFKALQAAETETRNYRALTKLAIRNFIESGAINQLQTEKAA